MCGLAYLYQPSLSVDELRNRMLSALTRLTHRGPDDEGLWCNHPVAIGHRRLAIIDLEASRQPMIDPDDRFVLTYNGEIYNYKTLRRELEGKWKFRTKGDTEVILAGIALYGISFLERMDGMWSLAIWDRTNNTLMLSRDRMGKKPLYYQILKNGFACASELPALACLTDEDWQEDLDSTADYFRYGYHLPGTTAYRNIREVLPGYSLEWRPRSDIKETSYWSLPISRFSGTHSEACLQLREKLVQSVEKRLVADVEVGAFLSGGIDSSLIVGILNHECKRNPKTFTIGFNEPSYDESRFAKQVAEYFGTHHHHSYLENWDKDQLTSLVLNHIGQPFNDSSVLPTAMVSSLAAEYVKVALSGDGSDELFSGYQRYQAQTLLRWFTRLPKRLQHSIQYLIRSLPEPMHHHSRSLLKKAHLFFDILQRQQHNRPYIAPTFYAADEFAHLAPDILHKGHSAPGMAEETRADSLLEMMVSDSLVYLPQDILAKVDRASMAYSLETRAPFLDKDVVEFAFSLPRSWHRRQWRGKRMLQESFAELLPSTVWRRRKQGFSVPIQRWFKEGLGKVLLELLDRSGTPVRKKYVESMLRAHCNGYRDHGQRLWGIYIYLLWQQEMLNSQGTSQ